MLPNYNALPEFVSFSDRLNHAVAFMVLYLLLERAHPAVSIKNRVLLLFIFAVFIEVIQYFLPTRFAAVSDVLADAAGVIVAIFILPYLQRLPLIRRFYN